MNDAMKQKPSGAGHVLFLNPSAPLKLYRGIVCTWLSKAIYVWKPFDFVLLSGWLPPSLQASYLDSFLRGIDFEAICRVIESESVTSVVMSMSSIVWQDDRGFLLALRRRFPRLAIAVLGDVFQEREFVEEALAAEAAVIRHPLSPALADYFASGAADGSGVLRVLPPGVADLPEVSVRSPVDLPLPRHQLFLDPRQRSPFDKHRRSMMTNTSWSCPYRCLYCSYSSPYLPFAYRTPESVLRELAALQRLRVREIFFGDPTFGSPRDNGWEILRGMEREGLRFSWHCYLTPKAVPDDLLAMMARTGCHTVIVGVESSHPEALKRYNRSISSSEIASFIEKCHALSMDVCGDFIIGLNEPAEEWRELTDFAIRLKLDYASFNIYMPMLGSRERREAIAQGRLGRGEWGYDTTALKKSLVGHAENRFKCVSRFYGRPSYWLKRLSRIRTAEEVLIKLEEFFHLFLAHGRIGGLKR